LSTFIPTEAGRAGPRRITFVTNPDDCNLRCVFCRDHSPLARRTDPPASQPPARMPWELLSRVLEERRGSPLAEVIPSTRGEPLLYAHFDRLADRCAEQGLSLNVTTNGTFPMRGAAAWGERLYPVASDVKISWLGATAATAEALMPGLSFERALEDVRTFVSGRNAYRARTGLGCRVSFQVAALERNVTELPRIVELAASLGVDRVKVNHLQIHFESQRPLSLLRDAAAVTRWNAAVRATREAARALGDPPLLQNFVELAPAPDLGPPAPGPCPFLGREAWILWDGRFAPCFAPGAADGRLGQFGTVLERTLGEIWASPEYRRLVDHQADHPVCRACRLRRPGGA
jgi:MoaA/NifB/PqqE/SkfB family radical SAM enzyme